MTLLLLDSKCRKPMVSALPMFIFAPFCSKLDLKFVWAWLFGLVHFVLPSSSSRGGSSSSIVWRGYIEAWNNFYLTRSLHGMFKLTYTLTPALNQTKPIQKTTQKNIFFLALSDWHFLGQNDTFLVALINKHELLSSNKLLQITVSCYLIIGTFKHILFKRTKELNAMDLQHGIQFLLMKIPL